MAIPSKLMQAREALLSVNNGHGYPNVRSSTFVCPHSECRAFSQHTWGIVRQLVVIVAPSSMAARDISDTDTVVLAQCASCKKESLFVNSKLMHPIQSNAPDPCVGMPDNVIGDFQEARLILPDSPRGAAALLRLVVQKLLPVMGASKTDINGAIGELVKMGVINIAIQQALDSVRVIGNEAVHPGEMDIRDDELTAWALFNLVNFIVQKAIVEPKEIAELYQSLPAPKLAGIERRDI